ncbi:pirin family protein [Cryomorphaceae bacterium]|nr:pirin family protein [Cryomorphaceae bacterium]
MIRYLLPVQEIDMGGIPILQALPTQRVEQVDPYLLLHHGVIHTNPLTDAMHQGVGPHPHRGFSPVTFVIEGAIHHRDSRGHNQIARAGEVQWMHAGAGIVHSERPTPELVASGGHQEIIQLWINSPASAKMKTPTYQYLAEEEIPTWSAEEGIRIKLVAGTYDGHQIATETQSPLLILWVEAEAGSTWTLDIPTEMNASIYTIKGGISIEGFGRVDARTLAVAQEGLDQLSIEAVESGQFLVLAGAPIGEKVTQWGPYVMNSQTEIMEALRDYQMGKMGVLIEE